MVEVLKHKTLDSQIKEIFINFYKYKYNISYTLSQNTDTEAIKIIIISLKNNYKEHTDTEPTDKKIIGMFRYILINMPTWWVNNGITLNTISRNYSKIIAQIQKDKNNKNGKEKRRQQQLSIKRKIQGSVNT